MAHDNSIQWHDLSRFPCKRLSIGNEQEMVVSMSELISGKEALIALANGEDVEWRHPEKDWYIAPQCNMRTQDFFSGIYQFRLKPRTIKINGIEVPAPFKPKDGELFYHLTASNDSGYFYNTNKCFSQFGAWRTEEEIKQVVAALRSIFNECS